MKVIILFFLYSVEKKLPFWFFFLLFFSLNSFCPSFLITYTFLLPSFFSFSFFIHPIYHTTISLFVRSQTTHSYDFKESRSNSSL